MNTPRKPPAPDPSNIDRVLMHIANCGRFFAPLPRSLRMVTGQHGYRHECEPNVIPEMFPPCFWGAVRKACSTSEPLGERIRSERNVVPGPHNDPTIGRTSRKPRVSYSLRSQMKSNYAHENQDKTYFGHGTLDA
jgi:hypothetical protein